MFTVQRISSDCALSNLAAPVFTEPFPSALFCHRDITHYIAPVLAFGLGFGMLGLKCKCAVDFMATRAELAKLDKELDDMNPT